MLLAAPRAALVALALAAASISAPARAVQLPFAATLEIQFYPAPLLPPNAFSDSGVATVNGSGAAGHLTGLGLPGGALATVGLFQPVTTTPAIKGMVLTVSNDPGAFAGNGGGGFGGSMPLNGILRVCVFYACNATQNVANLNVPLSVVGAGGAAYVPGGLFAQTVIGAPWTTGTVSILSYTEMGGVSPLSNTGAPSGAIRLVTPILISTNLGSPIIPSFGILTLHFVPEPGTLALLGAGLAALVAAGRRSRPRADL